MNQALLSFSLHIRPHLTTAFGTDDDQWNAPRHATPRQPSAKLTIQHIGEYTDAFDELKETIRPEIELIESRVLAPTKELAEYVKKIRKTITKREHKVGLGGIRWR